MRWLFIFLGIIPLLLFSQVDDAAKYHVYSKNRLTIIDDYVTVTGIVKLIEASIDGDIHIQIMIDSVYNHMLTVNNFTKQNGCLVAEIVCFNDSPFRICNNYVSGIELPELGDYIQISGPLVFDKRHKWNEIHPIEKLVTLRSLLW